MSGQGMSAKLVKLDLAIRSQRRMIFGSELVGSDSWDIILVLYLADAEGRRLTSREAIDRAGGDLEVGRRRVAHLSHAGLIVGDGSGRLDDVVTLAPEAISRMEELIEQVWAQVQAI